MSMRKDEKMKKLYLFLVVLIFVVSLSGCREIKKEEVTTYRTKQIIASLFIDFKDFRNKYENGEEPKIENEKWERSMLIYLGREYIQDDLMKDHELVRSLIFAWGEGDIKYHVVLPGDEERYLAGVLNAATMTSYNISYVINLPAKLISNIRANFSLVDLNETMSKNSKIYNTVVTGSAIIFTLQDILVAFIGLFLAFIMTIIGLTFGLILHPIQTFADMLPCLLGIVKTIFYAFSNLFY